jgi:epoxyqueuosine reductase
MIDSAAIKAQAYGLGFDLTGITTLGPAETAPAFDEWLARGFDGEMAYLSRTADKRKDSRLPLGGMRSAIVVAMSYGGQEPPGPVARYARGDDYHDLMVERLNGLHHWIETQLGMPVDGKAYVDTGPILERDLARRAGLGWFGKNTTLINPGGGSFFFLGSLLLDLDLEIDEPFVTDHCGSCTRCIDACPTGALTAPRVLDSNRCISYLTIELKGEIPEAVRPLIGDLLYGCDICQDVCPWNRKFALPLREDSLRARPFVAHKSPRDLARDVLALSADEFRSAFKGSPMKRAKLRGLKRNAAVVLGNVGDASDVDALTHARTSDEPVEREAAAWAIERIGLRGSSDG